MMRSYLSCNVTKQISESRANVQKISKALSQKAYETERLQIQIEGISSKSKAIWSEMKCENFDFDKHYKNQLLYLGMIADLAIEELFLCQGSKDSLSEKLVETKKELITLQQQLKNLMNNLIYE